MRVIIVPISGLLWRCAFPFLKVKEEEEDLVYQAFPRAVAHLANINQLLLPVTLERKAFDVQNSLEIRPAGDLRGPCGLPGACGRHVGDRCLSGFPPRVKTTSCFTSYFIFERFFRVEPFPSPVFSDMFRFC